MGSLPPPYPFASPLPATQTAILTTSTGFHTPSHTTPTPSCSPTGVLVRVRAVALNPTDHKTPARVKADGLTAGCDFAGEVVQVGERANHEGREGGGGRPGWAPGDRVCGVVYGSNPGAPGWGAFAEWVEADPVMLCRVPVSVAEGEVGEEDRGEGEGGWNWETAAAVGGSVHGSVALCLFGGVKDGRMGLDLGGLQKLVEEGKGAGGDDQPRWGKLERGQLSKEDLKKVVLVYGGSTACGTMALQLLRLAGYIPITTCSPHNADLVTSYGAAATFDYHSQTCADEIKRYTSSALAFALDCIGTAQSAALCYAAIGRAGGRYVALEKYPDSVAALRKVVKPSWVMGPVMFGRALQLGDGYSQPADPSARVFARVWYPLAEGLLQRGKLRSHPVRVVVPQSPGAWPEAVIRGLGELRDGKVSAQKLAVRIA